MRKLKLKEQLTQGEIEKGYRGSAEGVARSQWQIIWLFGQGKNSQEVASVTGYSITWVRTIVGRYNEDGPAGIGDRRHSNPGRRGALSALQNERLKQLVREGAARGENWNGQRVAAWMSEQLGRPMYMQRGYEWLAKYGMSAQVPRPQHAEADVEEQRIFKKSSQ
jgi:transposase